MSPFATLMLTSSPRYTTTNYYLGTRVVAQRAKGLLYKHSNLSPDLHHLSNSQVGQHASVTPALSGRN